MQQKIAHVDEKVLSFEDKASISPEEISKHYAKPIRGYAVISDNKTGEVIETPNLVLLSGREYIAQKIADVSSLSKLPESALDLSQFKIRYFGVGTGGADTASQPNKVGPFDNDLDLNLPGKFADSSISTDESLTIPQKYQYLHDGRMKKILSDQGNIEILKEDHVIVISGQEITVEAYTTIKYTLIVNANELYKEASESGPFAFNEAALYAVHHENITSGQDTYSVPADVDGVINSKYNASYKTFARFTTITKWLELNDSLKIEWYILV